MKNFLNMAILLLAFSTNAQTLDYSDLKKIYRLNSIGQKCDYLYGKGFVKESNVKNSEIVLVKKKFVKKVQSFDFEIVILSNDTVTYSLNDPKKYIKCKSEITAYLHEQPKNENSKNSNTVIYKYKTKIIIVTETDEKQENSLTGLKLYNFSYYEIPKE